MSISSHHVSHTRKLILAAILPLALCPFPNVFAGKEPQFDFRHLTVADGISHSQVNTIARDRQGFLWFGTRSGLNRYDGYHCTVMVHSTEDSSSLSGDFILSLCVARTGQVWIGTQGRGLNCFDPVTGLNKPYLREFGPVIPSVVCLLEESNGDVLAGTSTGLYLVRRDSSGIHIDLLQDRTVRSPSDGWNSIRTLYEDKRGTLWIGTEMGVKTLAPESRATLTFARLPHSSANPASLGNGIVNGIVGDTYGCIWIGTRRGSVRRLDVSSREVKEVISDVQVRCMYSDSKGVIWVGTLDHGLYRIALSESGRPDISNFTHEPDNPGSLGANEVDCVFEGPTGKLWIGTNGAGVSIRDPIGRRFAYFHHIPNDPLSLGDNIVRALAEDIHGNLWVATYGGGLNILEQGTTIFRRYRSTQGEVNDNLVTSLLTRRNGEVWAGFAFGGLMRISGDGRRVIHYRHSPGDTTGLIGINVIRTMYEDRKGRVWIGTHGFGLLCYDQTADAFTRFTADPDDSSGLSGNHVWAICEDRDGLLWIGTWNRGVSRLDPLKGTCVQFTNRPGDSTSIADNPVLCISEDHEGRIWIGTAGGGLQMIPRVSRRVVHFTTANGFPDNMVYGVLEDSKNHLWVSTNKGLVQFDPETRAVRVFDEHDGIQSREFSQGACCKGRDGKLYFGGVNGFNAFIPDSIFQNPTPPPVVITRFVVFDKEIPLSRAVTATTDITLKRDQNFFSFEFAALDFTAPSKNRYAYRLEGFDRDWVNAGNRRLASYTNVEPGTYLFHVRGSNNDGVWNEQGAAIEVTVLPAFWETWWFRLLIGALVAGFLYAVYAYRVNKILAIERTRERIARDLHDEVSAILSGIAFFSRSVHQDPANSLSARSTHFMSLINQSSTEVLELLHDIIWSINPEGDRVENIFAKFRRYASDLCESRTIRHDFMFPESFPTHRVETEKRKHLWLLYKEMVTNAVRHSGCSELKIRFEIDHGGVIRLQVTDNGRGFDPGMQTGQHGLQNIRARAKFLGADLALRTSVGQGTTWDFSCKMWV